MEKILQTVCIAGKNNIAVNIAKHILVNYKEIELVAIFNINDTGENTFQRSFKRFCAQNNIKEVSLDMICDDSNLLFLSLEYDKIIRPQFFASDRLFNIHFSALPKYKGMYTSALPILHGEQESGVTLHKIERGIDTGDIVCQHIFKIDPQLNAEALYLLYINYGTELILNKLNELIANTCSALPQPAFDSTYFSKKVIDYNNIKINLFSTASQILRQVNAFAFPQYQLPEINSVKVYKAKISEEKSMHKWGFVEEENDFYFKIATMDYDVFLFKDRREKLFEIAEHGNIDAFNKFYCSGYDIRQRSQRGWDIAIIAAYYGKFEFLDYLVRNIGWDINTYNNNGTTLSMYIMTEVSKSDNVLYLKKFITENQIDVNHVDFDGVSLMTYAKKYGNNNVIELLNSFSNRISEIT
ncbi:formyltransferase family protein [Kaistella solincola]|uniref:formyltransferase family protein n=1 Tax=Kaistella solincola TaxID=510955 RepID=UPI0006911396|nr:formyltransferase family protein [Kaistella solincola]